MNINNYDIQIICCAYTELNAIRARDGVPRDYRGYKYSVNEEYFSSIIDNLNKLVEKLTGKPAHCHPTLYHKYDVNGFEI
jgi:hypothetical protein